MLLLASLSLASCAVATHVVKRAPDNVPPFVVEYAPMVYLYSGDPYRPSDIASQLVNTQPEVDFKVVIDQPLTLNNLTTLNDLGGKNVYLTSKVKPDLHPEYLHGVLPSGDGKTDGAVSCTIIVNDHGDDTVDAFYFYFYAFDRGALDIGDHVGDWEHSVIRFQNGLPYAVWYSQHSNGQAFKYSTVHKYDDGAGSLRPIVYSANGSHANYATTGTHAYGIPNVNLPEGIIEDYTNNGPRWDPTLSAYWYSYNNTTNAFTAYNSEDPIDWLSYIGRWGDKQYPDDDKSQFCFLKIDALCKYTNGPTGPADKQLQRKKVCPDNGIPCIVRNILVQRAAEGEAAMVEDGM